MPLGDRTYKHFFIAQNCARMLKDREQKAFFSLLTENKTGSLLTDRLKSLVEAAKQNSQWRMQFMTWEQQMNLERRLGREEGIAIGEKQGIAQGERRKALEATRNLLAMHLGTLEQIAQAQGLELSEVQQIATDLAQQG